MLAYIGDVHVVDPCSTKAPGILLQLRAEHGCVFDFVNAGRSLF